MNLVVIGTGGRLGGALARHFRLAGHRVIGFDRTALDLARPEIIRDRLLPLAFHAVLLPAAMTSLEAAEARPDLAHAVNVEGPALVAAICAQRGARLIHFSTDYTYDGSKHGLRTESDPVAPLGVYARTKEEGERRVLEATNGEALVARVSWIFGPDRPSFPDQLLDRARRGEPLSAIADKASMPTSALDIAGWLAPFIDGPLRTHGGVLNVCNTGPAASWHTYGETTLRLAAELGIRLRSTSITPTRLADAAGFKAPRPVNTAMSPERLASLIGTRPRPWPEALREYLHTYHAAA